MLFSGKHSLALALSFLKRQDLKKFFKESPLSQDIARKTLLSNEFFVDSGKDFVIFLHNFILDIVDNSLKTQKKLAQEDAFYIQIYLDFLNLIFERHDAGTWAQHLENMKSVHQKFYNLYLVGKALEVEFWVVNLLYSTAFYMQDDKTIPALGLAFSLLSGQESQAELSLVNLMLARYKNFLHKKNNTVLLSDFLKCFFDRNFGLKNIEHFNLDSRFQISFSSDQKKYILDRVSGTMTDENGLLMGQLPYELIKTPYFQKIKHLLPKNTSCIQKDNELSVGPWFFYRSQQGWRVKIQQEENFFYLILQKDVKQNLEDLPEFLEPKKNIIFMELKKNNKILIMSPEGKVLFLCDFHEKNLKIFEENGDFRKGVFFQGEWRWPEFLAFETDFNAFHEPESNLLHLFSIQAKFKFLNKAWILQEGLEQLDKTLTWNVVKKENVLSNIFISFLTLKNSKEEFFVVVPKGSYKQNQTSNLAKLPFYKYEKETSLTKNPYVFKLENSFLIPQNLESYFFLMNVFLATWSFEEAHHLLASGDKQGLRFSHKDIFSMKESLSTLNPISAAFFCKLVSRTRVLASFDPTYEAPQKTLDLIHFYYQSVHNVPLMYQISALEADFLDVFYIRSHQKQPLDLALERSKKSSLMIFAQQNNFYGEGFIRSIEERRLPLIIQRRNHLKNSTTISKEPLKEYVSFDPFPSAFAGQKSKISLKALQKSFIDSVSLTLPEKPEKEIFSCANLRKEAVSLETRVLAKESAKLKIIKAFTSKLKTITISLKAQTEVSEQKKMITKLQKEIERITQRPFTLAFQQALFKSYGGRFIKESSLGFLRGLSPKDLETLNEIIQEYLVRSVFLSWCERVYGYAQQQELFRLGRLLLDINIVLEEHGPSEPWWMVFQFFQGVIVRDYQRELAEEAVDSLLNEGDGKAYQCLMGQGKSHVILPLIMLLWAQKNEGRKLLFVVIPPSLLASQTHSIRTGVENTLNTVVFEFNFDRNTLFNFSNQEKIEYFGCLWLQLQTIRLKNYCIVTDAFSLLALEAYIREFLHSLSPSEKEAMRDSNDHVPGMLNNILNLLSQHGAVIFDELDTLLPSKTNLNFSLGDSECISLEHIEITSLMFEFILKTERMKKDFFEALQSLQKDKKIKFFASLKEQFFNSETSPLLKFISKDALKKEKIQKAQSFFENQDLDLSLEKSFSSALVFFKTFFEYFYASFVVTEGYGHSFGLLNDRIVPCSRGEPIQGSKFEDPIFEMICAFLAYLQTSLPERLSLKEIEHLQSQAQTSAEESYTFYHNTQEALLFTSICQDNLPEFGAEIPKDLLLKISENSLWIAHVVKKQVAPNITYEKHRVSLTTTELAWLKSSGFSGTLACLGSTLPPGIAVNPNHVFADSIFSNQLIEKNTNVTVVATKALENTSEKETAYLLKNIFELKGNNFSALIDVDGWFCKDSNIDVAKEIAFHLKNTQKKHVLFFNASGKVEAIRISDGFLLENVPNQKPEDIFVYYDLAHTRGADFKLSHQALGYITCGSNTTLTALLQGVARLRLFLEGAQEVCLLVAQDLPSDLKDILNFCQKTEKQHLDSETFLLAKNKIVDLFRKKIRKSNASPEALCDPAYAMLIEHSEPYNEEVRSKKIESISAEIFLRRFFKEMLQKYDKNMKEEVELLNSGLERIVKDFLEAVPCKMISVYEGTCFTADISFQKVHVQQQMQVQVQETQKSENDVIDEDVSYLFFKEDFFQKLSEYFPEISFDNNVLVTKNFPFCIPNWTFQSPYVPQLEAFLVLKSKGELCFVGLPRRELQYFRLRLESFLLVELNKGEILEIHGDASDWVSPSDLLRARAQFLFFKGDFNKLSELRCSWIFENHTSLCQASSKMAIAYPLYRDRLPYFQKEYLFCCFLDLILLDSFTSEEEVKLSREFSKLSDQQKENACLFFRFFLKAKNYYFLRGEVYTPSQEENISLEKNFSQKYILRATLRAQYLFKACSLLNSSKSSDLSWIYPEDEAIATSILQRISEPVTEASLRALAQAQPDRFLQATTEFFQDAPVKILKDYRTPRGFLEKVKALTQENKNLLPQARSFLQKILPFYHQAQVESQRWFRILSWLTLSIFYVLAMLVIRIYRFFSSSGWIEKNSSSSDLQSFCPDAQTMKELSLETLFSPQNHATIQAQQPPRPKVL